MEKCGLHDLPSLKGNPPSHHDEKNRGKGNNAQAPHLKKNDSDHLPEKREALADVDSDQSSHADRRGGGEEGVNEGDRVPGSGKGQPQKKCAQEDIARKTQDEDALWR